MHPILSATPVLDAARALPVQTPRAILADQSSEEVDSDFAAVLSEAAQAEREAGTKTAVASRNDESTLRASSVTGVVESANGPRSQRVVSGGRPDAVSPSGTAGIEADTQSSPVQKPPQAEASRIVVSAGELSTRHFEPASVRTTTKFRDQAEIEVWGPRSTSVADKPNPPIQADRKASPIPIPPRDAVERQLLSQQEPDDSQPIASIAPLKKPLHTQPISTSNPTGAAGPTHRSILPFGSPNSRRATSQFANPRQAKELGAPKIATSSPPTQFFPNAPHPQTFQLFHIHDRLNMQGKAKLEGTASVGISTEAEGAVSFRLETTSSSSAPTPHSIPIRMEMPANVSKQIAEALQHMPGRPVEITLSPEELGRVRLAVTSSEAGILVNVLAERPETIDLLRRHIGNLENAFQDLGYQDIAFSFSNSGTEADEGNDKRRQSGAKDFSHTDEAPATRITLASGPLTGVDIRL